MDFSCGRWPIAGIALLAFPVLAQQTDEAVLPTLGVVTVTASQPTSLPSRIPATLVGADREQISATINVTDSEDALKYFPSLLVRKRYVGDYNHAVLSSRASGTGNSARSAVYVDGMPISNYLGNGAAYAPRWDMVQPAAIERVEVMYGPFSAAYPGNSAGAIVDYITRMPQDFEGHAAAGVVLQPSYQLYSTDASFAARQFSASLGDRHGDLGWRLGVDHTHSHGQPQTFVTRTVNSGTSGNAGTAVTGAVPDRDRSNNPWYLLGTGAEYITVQDQLTLKLVYDIEDDLHLSYRLGIWRNDSQGEVRSWLRDAAGNAVYGGTVSIEGRSYTLAATDFAPTRESLLHLMQGISLKRQGEGDWHWELAASGFEYLEDELRSPGMFTDQQGTGWRSALARGSWRSADAVHAWDAGLQLDAWRLRILRSADTGATLSEVGGRTAMRSAWLQDSWTLAERWHAVLGLRLENWRAEDGRTVAAGNAMAHAPRSDSYLSPKAALSFAPRGDLVLKAALGRAVRMPTVNELYGATSGVLTLVNDPALRAEKSWTGELSLEGRLARLTWRATAFHETVRDSLYSERSSVNGSVVTRIVNVGRIETPGVELALQSQDWLLAGLQLSASITWADSRIRANHGFAAVPGDTIGRHQPRVPAWRATALASYRINGAWNAALGLRYSGTQYSTLDNSDPNGFAWQGASRYLVADARLRWRGLRWTGSVGVDNLNDYRYWNFHPYPQRSVSAELRYDF